MRPNLLFNSIVYLLFLYLLASSLAAQESTTDTLYFLVQVDGTSQQVNPKDIVDRSGIETRYTLTPEEAQARYQRTAVVEYYLFSGRRFADVLNEEIYKNVEENPRFPGCEDLRGTVEEKEKCSIEQFLEFIYKNLKYPEQARALSIQGAVVIRFIVEKDGSISNIELVKSIGFGCDEEALRVVELMNVLGMNWVPGKQNGQPVRVKYSCPIRFKLE